MNSIYQVIWSVVQQCWVVVSELTTSQGKTKSTRSRCSVIQGVKNIAVFQFIASGCAAAAFLTGIAVPGTAQADVWTGKTSPIWSEASNWGAGNVPDNGATVYIDDSQSPVYYPEVIDSQTVHNTRVGYNAGRYGKLTINGAGADLLTAHEFRIGDSGHAELTVSNGGSAEARFMYIGAQAGGNGTVTVSGLGSSIQAYDALSVSIYGTGQLTLANGGVATLSNSTANMFIGSQPGSVGTVTVDGAGSALTVSGMTYAGYNNASTGVLTVSNGGTVLTNEMAIGLLAGSSGTVTVTGAGSSLTANSFIDAGVPGGSGKFTIAKGGVVNAGSTGLQIGGLGILNIGAAQGETAVAAGTLKTTTVHVTSGGQIIFNHTDPTYQFAPTFTDSAQIKQLSGNTSLTGAGSQVNSVDVQGGTLQFTQNGAFTVTGGYTTQAGGTTVVGMNDPTLNVGGAFTQNAGSTLSVALDDQHPVIVATNATLDGLLTINGFTASPNNVSLVSSSELENTRFTVVHTSNGVTGNFTNSSLDTGLPDYLTGGGLISPDGKDYNVGLALAWTHGGQAKGTGTFTLNAGTGFNVDTVLADQTGSFNSGWDGKSLTKAGDGLLILSANNTYSGPTTVAAGTLALSGAGTLGTSAGTTLVDAGVLELGGTTQTQASLFQSGGTVQGGGLNVGTYTLTGGTLAANAKVNANTLFDFQAGNVDGVLGGAGLLRKSTAGTVTVSGTGSQVNSVAVQGGTLQFMQNGAFAVTNDYTTQSGGITQVGLNNSTLNTGGAFIQNAGSTLSVALNDQHPVIVANTASLAGELRINGFATGPNNTSLVRSSELENTQFTVVHTSSGITGNFTNSSLDTGLPDYLTGGGLISPDGKDYNVGLALAWTHGGQAKGTGTFTLAAGTGFNVDTVLADQAGSFTSGWDGKSLTKAGDGLLALSAVNTYTGATTLNGGTLRTDVPDSLVNSSNVTLNGGVFDLNGNNQQVNNPGGTGGEVHLNGATLTAVNATTADNTTYAGSIIDGGAKGSLTKAGGGTLTLTGNTGWTGDTRIDAGELVLDGSEGGAKLISNIIGQDNTALSLRNGASLTGSVDPTNVSIDSASTWNMTADSQVNNVNLAGTLNVATPAALPVSRGHTLTAANWNGQGGTVVLNTVLGGDASVTDKIVVNGDTQGNTFLKVHNAGGQGAQTTNGIQVVEVNGQSDGTFTRSGRIVAGAYDYDVVKKGANWYLSSQPLDASSGSPDIRPESGSYTANLAAANLMFVTRLHDRLGETQYTDALTGEQKVTSLWLRQVGGHNSWKDSGGQTETQANRYVVQLGGDVAQWSPDNLQRWHIGVMGGYGNDQSNTHSSVTGNHAEGTASGYSVGMYATWYHNDETKQGMYVDSWAQYSWFNNEVKGQDIQKESYNSDGPTASLELGYTHKLGEYSGSQGGRNAWFIQPQAQAVWMGVKTNDHQESNGTQVSGEGDGHILTRLGVRTYLKGHSSIDEGNDRTFQPYVEMNWLHNTGDFGSRMDGVTVYQAGARNIGEMKMGVEGQLNARLALWGNVGVQVGDKGYNDTSVLLGAKYSF